MPRADYYIIAEADHDSRELLACRLCEKAISQDMSVQVYLKDEVDLAQLDQRLWSFKSDAFLPHSKAPSCPSAPIRLTTDDSRLPNTDLLINLAVNSPSCATEFARVIEIVSQDPAVLNTTRNSFKERRDQGWELHRHDQRKPR